MPTVVALDVSLSMCRPVKWEGSTEDFSRKNLAISGLCTLMDHFASNCKLEFVSLVAFSYLWEQLVPFTRDTDALKAALNTVGDYSKTCFEPVLTGVASLVLEEWGTITPVQVILVTDGTIGVGTGSLANLIQTWDQQSGTEGSKCPLPFPFKGKLHIVCIASQNDPQLKKALPLYQRLIELNNNAGEIHMLEGSLSLSSVNEMFTELSEKLYGTYLGLLTCGHFKCNVSLYPAPDPFDREEEFYHTHKTVSDQLEICGFMDLQDIASPPTISRHLALPIATNKTASKSNTESPTEKSNEEGEEEVDESKDDGKLPSFTVLLHGSLKMEGMVAITRVAEDWYGILYSWADSKKKSSLMLSLFEPGIDAVSWLGNLNFLAPIADFSEPPYGEDDNRSPFPVRPKEKRSYAQSCVVWIKAVGLQADLQKVIRHARKLPDKQQQFYKELNRIRKAALSFGFLDLLEAMAAMLERECTMLPGTAHPDAALQLTHAASKLRSDVAKDSSQIIMPLRTNFSQDDT